MEKEVEKFRRERDDLAVPGHAIAVAISQERPEPERLACHRRGFYSAAAAGRGELLTVVGSGLLDGLELHQRKVVAEHGGELGLLGLREIALCLNHEKARGHPDVEALALGVE